MGLIERIGKWLTSANTILPKKGHPVLYPIDVKKLTKDLNLIEEAKRLGEAGIPSSDATVPSGPESAAIQRVEKARQDYVDWACIRLNIICQELNKRSITKVINRARQADQEFERKASALLTGKDNLLHNLGNTASKSKSELEAFKSRHCLTHDAIYPTRTKALLLSATLIILIVIEGLLNATFFSQGLDTGLIGGAIQAMSLAAINVAVAYLFGRFAVRYVNHVNIGFRLLGFLGIALSLAVIFTIGLSIAHYRDALTSEMAEPARVALQALLAHPIQLMDFFSWALFAISIAVGVMSLLDGLYSDDLYPGYGDISKRTRQAIDDFEDELNTLRVGLEELKNEELKALDQTVQLSQSALAVFASLINEKRDTKLRLSAAFDNADNSLNAILHNFRTENEVHRKGLPPPSYFNAPTDLRPLNLPDFDTTADEALLFEQRKLMNLLLKEVQEIRARIQAAFNHKFDRLKPLNSQFQSEETL